ncbi:MAG: DUF134 domain-containing protein [Sedimentisphaerales bacterium]|nr:DUF134 domain-containing protein [Sedimentisphaerales bacterium]
MPRPCRDRIVSGPPGCVVYKPAGVPARTLEWVRLALDEFETIRLLDYQGLDQEEVARMMGVSRPTVTRIYARARQKIAQALTEGKAISIEGVPYTITGPMQTLPAYGMGRGRGRHGWRGGRGPGM